MSRISKYKQVLITGGSSGIGLGLAERMVSLSKDVIIIGKEDGEVKNALEYLQQISNRSRVSGLSLDLTNEEALHELLNYLSLQKWKIDLLINNAGYGRAGKFWELNKAEEQGMIDLHIKATYLLTKSLLEQMIRQDHGNIVNISSISAFQPNPGFAVYGATKAFLYHWSIALREELRMSASQVRVQTICPTPVHTQFQKNAKMEDSYLFDSWLTVDVDLVVNEILKAVEKDIRVLIPGKRFHYLEKITSRFPLSLKLFLAKWHLRNKNDL